MEELIVGQIWCFDIHNSIMDKGSCIITGIEGIDNNRIVHIAIKNININGDIFTINHMPFNSNVFCASVIKVVGKCKITKGMKQSILDWKKDRGGAYNISISEALELLCETLR